MPRRGPPLSTIRRRAALLGRAVRLVMAMAACGPVLRAQTLAASPSATASPAPGLSASLMATGPPAGSTPIQAMLGLQAIGVVTDESPALAGRRLTEAYVTQPVLMGHLLAAHGHLALVGTIDFEGATLARGELTPGIYGEGYVDRRHPHTYAHELMASTQAALLAHVRASLAGGKGFVPFGSDDPMTRPFEHYPVNHHLAQILERWVAIAATRVGPVMVEAATFDGDEPISPSSWPRVSRFGDSYAGRVTVSPVPHLEFQASAASVISPEIAAGGGLDQRKLSTSARYDVTTQPGTRRYALVEWEQTDEMSHGIRAFRFQSVLAEGFAQRHGLGLGIRYERTSRPEEDRLTDPFRTPVPPADADLLGITQWTTWTAALSADPWYAHRVSAAPFVEVAYATPKAVLQPTLFDPQTFYGGDHLWVLSVGIRLRFGDAMHRMGRYGVATDGLHGMGNAAMPMATPM